MGGSSQQEHRGESSLMPRGVILVRVSKSWDEAIEIIRAVQKSPCDLAAEGAVVESWGPCLGVADMAVVVYGVSVEAVRRAASGIREAMDAGVANGATLTSTIMVSTPGEVERAPLELHDILARKEIPNGEQDDVATRRVETLTLFLAETFQSLLVTAVGALAQGGIDATSDLAKFLVELQASLEKCKSISQLMGDPPETMRDEA